jgi:hypothetical protein
VKAIPTVEQMWLGWAVCVLPPSGVSNVQRREMKRAFFAGVSSILSSGYQSIGDAGMSEDEGAAVMQNWWNECATFAEAVREGKA